jgi:hypothetical protein
MGAGGSVPGGQSQLIRSAKIPVVAPICDAIFFAAHFDHSGGMRRILQRRFFSRN